MHVPHPLLRPHPPSVLITPCPLLEKEDCHHEGADLREVRVPCGGGHEPLQGLSLPSHLAPQRPSAAAQREELWLRLVRVSRLGGREPPVLWVLAAWRLLVSSMNLLFIFMFAMGSIVYKISLATEENVFGCC